MSFLTAGILWFSIEMKMVSIEKMECFVMVYGEFAEFIVPLILENGSCHNDMQNYLIKAGFDPQNFSWHDIASCQHLSFNLFFEDYETDKMIAREVDNICLSCPVQKECFNAGIENKEIGVWGGFYLINGEPDKAKNNHKTQEIVHKMTQRIFSNE